MFYKYTILALTSSEFGTESKAFMFDVRRILIEKYENTQAQFPSVPRRHELIYMYWKNVAI